MIDWSNLKNFDDWASALDGLLEQGHAALRADDVNGQVEVQKLLRAFRQNSPNEYCRRLDEIAEQAVLDIAAGSVHAGIQGIAARSAELDGFVKDIRSTTVHTQRITGWLSLENPRETAKSLTEVVLAFKELKAAADKSGDDDGALEVAKRANAAATAVIRLREMIEKTF